MVELVGHAFMDRPVNLDIHVVSGFVGAEVGGEMGRSRENVSMVRDLNPCPASIVERDRAESECRVFGEDECYILGK